MTTKKNPPIHERLNTITMLCGKASDAAQFEDELESAGFQIETVPTFSQKHVFHFTGHAARSSAFILRPDANPYDVFALLAESEISNPFLVWDPEETKIIVEELSDLKQKFYKGDKLSETETARKTELEHALKAQRKPIILYGSEQEWEPFKKMLESLVEAGTARPGFRESLTFYHPENTTNPDAPGYTEGLNLTDFIYKRVNEKDPGKLWDYKDHTFDTGLDPINSIVAEDDPRKRSRVTISYFGSATTRDERHLEAAHQSVHEAKKRGWGLVNGGGNMGVMGAQLTEAKKEGVFMHGISADSRGAVGLAGSEKDPEAIKNLMTRYTDCKDMIHRIECYLEHSEGIGCLDGGIGSGEELFMVLELMRQEHHVTQYQGVDGKWYNKPMVVIDQNGTWGGKDGVIEWAKAQFGPRYFEMYGREFLERIQMAESVEHAHELFDQQLQAHPPKLSTEVMDKIIQDAEAELRDAVPGIDIESVDGNVKTGRPKALKDSAEIMSTVDLTKLNTDITQKETIELCDRAVLENARSVCIPLNVAGYARKRLDDLKSKVGHDVKVVTVVNFPEGTQDLATTQDQIRSAIGSQKSVDEIDMVIPYHLLKEGQYQEVYDYLKASIATSNVPVKVIIESGALGFDRSEDGLAEPRAEMIAKASLLAKAAGASCVKTSTGMWKPAGSDKAVGADVEAVEIMRRSVGDDIQIKASGGVKTFEQAMAVIEAGADIIGASGLTLSQAKQRISARPMNEPQLDSLPSYAMRGDQQTAVGGGY